MAFARTAYFLDLRSVCGSGSQNTIDTLHVSQAYRYRVLFAQALPLPIPLPLSLPGPSQIVQ
jgi:hypothetical protein